MVSTFAFKSYTFNIFYMAYEGGIVSFFYVWPIFPAPIIE